jgi:plastocyanin
MQPDTNNGSGSMKRQPGNFRRNFIIAGMALFLIASACGKDSDSSTNPGEGDNPPDNPPSNLVTISNFAFSPQSITVSAGDTVTWRNDDNVNHTVTSDSGGEPDSPVLSQGQIYQHVFAQPGTHSYHCTIHPTMTGNVAVQ